MSRIWTQLIDVIVRVRVLIKGKYMSIAWFAAVILIASILEGFSLGSLYPMINVLLDEGKSIQYYETLQGYIPFTFGLDTFTVAALIAIAFIFIAKNVFLILSLYEQHRISQMCEVNWQSRIFNSYLRKDYSFFIQSKMGDLIQRQMVHTKSCTQTVLYMCGVARDLISTIFVFLVLFLISRTVTLWIAATLLVFSCFFIWLSKTKIYYRSKEHAEWQQKVYSTATEGINGIREIKLFGAEAYFENTFFYAALKQAEIYIRNATMGLSARPIMQIALVLGLTCLLLILPSFGLDLKVLAPLIIVFGGGIHKLVAFASSINTQIMQLSNTIPSIVIVSDLLSSSLDTDLEGEEGKKFKFSDRITFDAVSFAYLNQNQSQLHSISFEFERGKYYGIVGPSGCGKSTLLDLLIGLYEPDRGEIRVDGSRLRQIGMRNWRGLLGVVSQHVFIFNGTLRENIAFALAADVVNQEKVIRVSEAAGLADLLKRLPQGLDTQVGEKGFKLSGGERQRLSIARALYREPEICIFDEAMSSLDSDSEQRIQLAIKMLTDQRKTIIAVAHRLSSIHDADQLVIMEEGRIVAYGPHKNLLEENPYYAELVELQHHPTSI